MALKIRNMIDGNVVWFGSIGKNENGTAIKADSFVSEQQSVSIGLTQRLSVIRKELWYKVSYGLPLFDKISSKTALDSFVTSTILAHPDVKDIVSFTSSVKNHAYSCKAEILSIYGPLDFSM